MFDLTQWKEKLKGSINTSDVKNNLSNLESEISRELLPAYVSLSEVLDGNFNSDFTKEADKYFLQEFKNEKIFLKRINNANVLDYQISLLRNLLNILPWLGNQFSARTIHVEGMELRQSNLVQMVELVEFSVRYLTEFLNVSSYYELNNIPGSNQKVGKLTPTQEDYLEIHRYSFVIAMTILHRELSSIKAAYGKIPALIADSEKYQQLVEVVGHGNADPLNLSTPPFPLSIIFYPQMVIANWQMDRLERLETTSKLVQYRVVALKRKQDSGEGDANIEKEITIQEERLSQLQRKLVKTEEQYGLRERG